MSWFIRGGGITKSALEAAPEVVGSGTALSAGAGATIYDAIVTLSGAVTSAGVKAVIKTFDQG